MSSSLYDEIDDSKSDNDIVLRPTSTTAAITQNSTNQKYGTSDDDNMSVTVNVNHKLSLVSKICFALGGLPYQMCVNALSLYLSAFLLEIGRIRPYQISIVLFTARGVDAVTDPLIGFLVSKTNTRFGKLRPWILFSAPFGVITYMMMWYVPNFSQDMKTFWYLVAYCLFQTFSSCLRVPHTSLTMYLTPNQAERDSATGIRMLLEILGVLLAAAIQGVMITIIGSITSCDSTTTTRIMTTKFNQTFITEATTKAPGLSKPESGYLISAAIMAIMYFGCSCATFFGTREMKDVIEDKDGNFFKAFKTVFSHRSYITLLLTFLFNSLAVQIVQTNFALYCKYSIPAKDIFQIVLIVLLVSSIVTLPLWNYLIIKVGKKATYAAGLILFIPCLFALLYINEPVWLIYIVSVIAGFGISVNYLLPWSMLPDVIDEFMVKTGTRRESIFYSFFVFFTKLSAGVAVGLSTAFLDVGGYVDCPNGCCKQPESVGSTLRLLIVPAPLIMILISLITLWKHPIDENRRIQIKETLKKLREARSSD